MNKLELWSEVKKIKIKNYPEHRGNKKNITIIKYNTDTEDLAGIVFKVKINSGTLPDVNEHMQGQKQSKDFQYLDKEDISLINSSTGLPESSDAYLAKWNLCSSNSETNIITLAGTNGIKSDTNNTNILFYLHNVDLTIDSIFSVTNSDAQSYSKNNWTFENLDKAKETVKEPSEQPTSLTTQPTNQPTYGSKYYQKPEIYEQPSSSKNLSGKIFIGFIITIFILAIIKRITIIIKYSSK